MITCCTKFNKPNWITCSSVTVSSMKAQGYHQKERLSGWGARTCHCSYRYLCYVVNEWISDYPTIQLSEPNQIVFRASKFNFWSPKSWIFCQIFKKYPTFRASEPDFLIFDNICILLFGIHSSKCTKGWFKKRVFFGFFLMLI